MDVEKNEVVEDKSLKPVRFTWKGEDYTLEFTRASLKATEDRFDIDLYGLMTGKVMAAPDLFRGALLLHHPNVNAAKAKAMYADMKNKTALHARLVGMVTAVVMSTFDEPDEGNAVSWE